MKKRVCQHFDTSPLYSNDGIFLNGILLFNLLVFNELAG